MYSSAHYAGEQPCKFTINWLLSIFKTAVVKPLAHCKWWVILYYGSIYSLITSLSFADFKGLPNGTKFILIDHCIGELLSINKVSSKCEHTIVLALLWETRQPLNSLQIWNPLTVESTQDLSSAILSAIMYNFVYNLAWSMCKFMRIIKSDSVRHQSCFVKIISENSFYSIHKICSPWKGAL